MAAVNVSEQVMDRYLIEQLNKEPEQDFHYDNMIPATRLIEKRKELLDVQSALDTQKEEYAARLEKVNDQEANLSIKAEHLLLLREQCDDFANSKAQEYKKHLERAAAHRSEINRIERETERLRAQFARENARLAAAKAKCDKLDPYRSFLESLKEEEGEFDEIEHITGRYNILETTQKDLINVSKAWGSQSYMESNESRSFIMAQREKIMEYNTEMGVQMEELEELNKKAKDLEGEYELLIRASKAQIRTLGSIVMAVGNLYDRIIEWRAVHLGKKTLERTDNPYKQLTEIGHFFSDLRNTLQNNLVREAGGDVL